jgi:leucyl-tRNA synthetase
MVNEEKDGYDPSAVEEKWQRRWNERGTNTFALDELLSAPEPFYNLMMFPYPSAEGLHIGNIYAFTGADAHGRFQRLRGRTVFEPMGFDAFGIHSENFALKVGKHPMDLIPSNVANFTRQLKRIGGMFDWEHSVDTTQPDYYKWTQWVFVQLLKAGLAERKEAPVNWCPSCKTVLANEQVVGGECERCGTPVEQRRIAQWFFKITKYAQRLLDNLSHIDWSEKTKKSQVNWLGRSEGARLEFPVVDEAGTETGTVIEVYTTRPDTVFGATYMVLSPEHPLVDVVTNPGLSVPVYAYREKAKQKDLVARQKVDKTKTGVSTGGHCRNPATGEFELPIVRVVAGPGDDAGTPLEEAYVGPGTLVNSGPFDGTDVSESVRVLTAWAAENGWGEAQVNFRLHDWCVSRQRYWGPPIPVIHCESCGAVPVPEKDLPVLLPRVEDFKPDDSGVSPLARVAEWYETACPECGAPARRETDVSDTFLDSGWYFLRYPSTDFGDRPFDEAITKKWLPVDMYIGGQEHAVLHLLYSRFLTMVLHDLGHLEFEEPYDVFRAHGLIVAEGAKMSKSKGNVILPDPVIAEYGADTLRVYLMFMGPFEEGGDYRAEGIQGPYGFLHRLWDSVLSAADGTPDPSVERKVHQTIRQATEQIPKLQYNTAIAAVMECLNAIRTGGRTPVRAEVEPLVPLIAPFAPHVAEELWERLGHEGSIFDGANWPAFDPAKAVESAVTIAVQVNGKLRASIDVPKGASEADVVAAARAEENVKRHLDGTQERRVIYVKERLVNFVVG